MDTSSLNENNTRLDRDEIDSSRSVVERIEMTKEDTISQGEESPEVVMEETTKSPEDHMESVIDDESSTESFPDLNLQKAGKDASDSDEVENSSDCDDQSEEATQHSEESEEIAEHQANTLENEMSQVILGFHQSDVISLTEAYADYSIPTGLTELIQTLRIDR